jgi:CelD/BcsL family acetyltransferase involved in cellulose biosynthesis
MTIADSLDGGPLGPSVRGDFPQPDWSFPRPSRRAPQSSEKCEFALIADRPHFDALEAEWNALFERAGRPHQLFQTFGWLCHWANHYLDHRTRLSVVVARQEGRLVMIWPLVAIRAVGLTRLCWMGEPVSQYGDVLAEDGPARVDLLRQGWALVKALGADVIHLRKTRSDAVVFPLLQQAGALAIDFATAPYLDLASAEDYQDYERRYSAKKRARRRRLLRSLEEVATVTFERHDGGPAARDLVGHALALKHKWLVARGVIAPVLQDPRFGRFLCDVAGRRTGAAEIRVMAVSCNGTPGAVEVSFECRRHRVAYLISYDIELAKHGIGIIVAEHSIRTAHAQGLLRFDLLTPADPYKMEWADGSVEVRDWAMPLTRPGRLYVLVWLRFMRHWMRSATKGLPVWLRRRLVRIYRRTRATAD